MQTLHGYSYVGDCMNFQYKAVFVDLDGTLLNSKKTISERNLSCLNSLIKKGIHVVITTGRTIKSVKKVTEKLEISNHPVITLNGSDIRKDRDSHSMAVFYIDEKSKKMVFEYCKNINNLMEPYKIQNMLIDTANGFYCLHPNQMEVSEFVNHYDTDVKELNFDQIPTEPVIGFLLLLTPESNKNKFIADSKSFFKKNVAICTFNGWDWVELGSIHSNKGTAMNFVCDLLGIKVNEVIAFGDGHNDVEMLSQAGLGVAMANSDVYALNCADAKTLTNDEDGVAHFIEKISLKNNYNMEK